MENINRQPIAWIRILPLFLFFTFVSSDIKAGNYVKIATIGTKVSGIDKTKGAQGMVDQVIEFWRKQLLQVIYDKPDLIVLPEHCDYPGGLSQEERKEYIRVRKDQIMDYFKSVAKDHNCYIAFGMRREDLYGNLWNSGILVDRKGEVVGIYDKNFPTIYEMEDGIRQGTKVPVFQCDFGRVAIAICFDLNFQELRNQYATLKPDIILFPSAYHGGFLQSEWAYSCRSFFVGSIISEGSASEIRNPLGEIIASSTNYFDFAIAIINIDSRLVHLDYNMDRLRALKEKYGSTVSITDPGNMGVVLVSDEGKDINVDRLIKEFDIELLDHYFDRLRRFKLSHESIKQ